MVDERITEGDVPGKAEFELFSRDGVGVTELGTLLL